MTQELVSKYGDKLAITTIEVAVPDTTGRYLLPDDEILRNRRIVGLFVPTQSGSDKAPSGAAVVSAAAIKSSYLTLKVVNDSVMSEMPLSSIYQEQGVRNVAHVDLCSMNPSKSYIQVGDTSLVSAGQKFLLTIIYIQ